MFVVVIVDRAELHCVCAQYLSYVSVGCVIRVVIVVRTKIGDAIAAGARESRASERDSRHSAQKILEWQGAGQRGFDVGRLREILKAGYMADDGAVGIAITAIDQKLCAGCKGGGDVVLVPRRARSSSGDSIEILVGEKSPRLDRRVGVMKELAIDGEFRAEHVIDLHHVFAKIENISQRRYESEWISGRDQVRVRQFGEDILDVCRGDRVDGTGRDACSVGCARTGGPITIR